MSQTAEGSAVIEVLDDSQEWSIPLPSEDESLLDRRLEARGESDDDARARWRYDGNGWTCTDGKPKGAGIGVEGFSDLFEEIVAGCIARRWRLFSLRDTLTAEQRCALIEELGE